VTKPLRTVVFYRTTGGNEPVREWVKSLSIDEQKRIGKELAKLQFYSRWPAGLAKFLGNGLWELRVSLKRGEARVLFFEDSDELILVHGFWKKTRTTPLAILKEALTRKAIYEKRK
jgi:phage-related protein